MKLVTVLLLWMTIGITVTFGLQNAALRIALVIIGISIMLHVSFIRAKRKKNA